MKKVASEQGLTCLLHERPFEGINGSEIHNNWSISTNGGVNLLEPGKSPRENARFFIRLCQLFLTISYYHAYTNLKKGVYI